jgi:glycosyltransferase involved in cell wall biosynthesis
MSARPDFSVIIPTFDRPQALASCLDALCRLDRGGPTFEVLVVDDGGSAALDGTVAPLRDRLQLTLLRQEHAGPGAARNSGIRVARGRWMAFTDDDCLPDPQWLSGFAGTFAEHPDHLLGGHTVNLLKSNPYCAAHQLLVDYVTRHSRDQAGQPAFFASNNMAAPAELFRSLGGFDASFPFAAGEDRDLCARAVEAGYKLAEAPASIVRHQHPLGLRRFCGMHHRYGRGACRYRRKIAARHGNRVRLEAPGFYLGLLLKPFSAVSGSRAVPVCAALFLSQICHGGGYAVEKWSR